MSLSDRDVPMAKATFFIWEEKSSSMLALQGGASSARAQRRALRRDPAAAGSCPPSDPRRPTRPPAALGALGLWRPPGPAPRKTSLRPRLVLATVRRSPISQKKRRRVRVVGDAYSSFSLLGWPWQRLLPPCSRAVLQGPASRLLQSLPGDLKPHFLQPSSGPDPRSGGPGHLGWTLTLWGVLGPGPSGAGLREAQTPHRAG